MKNWMIRAELLSLLLLVAPWASAKEGDAHFAVSPESAYSLLDSALQSAQKSIEVNIYMLSNRAIAQTLADQAQKGVQVTILLEGETFHNEMLQPIKKTLDDLFLRFDQQSNGRGKFLVMSSQNKSVKRRFVFNHAKYVLIDGSKVFVSSENFTGSAFGNKNLTGGTRGWQILLESSALAKKLGKMFDADSSEKNADIVPYNKADFKVTRPEGALPPRTSRGVHSFPLTSGSFQKASLCASPDSLGCIMDFIESAKSELLVEHLSLPTYWRTGKTRVNPIVEALLGAAKRGVAVRVLLNDDASFGNDAKGGTADEDRNSATVKYLRAAAAKQGLSLEARLFSPQALQVNYLHNKGMVADGKRVFVSSINGTQNSLENNREVGVAVDSEDAARFYGAVFSADWTLSR